MALAMFSWAIAWTNAKIVNEYLSFYNLIFLRFFIGCVSIYPLIIKKNNIRVLTLQNLKFIIPASIIFYIYNLFFFMGTHYGYAGKGAVLVTTLNPIITFFIISRPTNKIWEVFLTSTFSVSFQSINHLFFIMAIFMDDAYNSIIKWENKISSC